MITVEDDIRRLLHSSEHLKAALEVVTILPFHGDRDSEVAEDSKTRGDLGKIIAVVAHRDHWRASEEGSVFVCNVRDTEDHAPRQVEVEHIFPITKGFSISVAQTRRGAAELPFSMAGQQTGFNLTLNPGQSLNPNTEHEPMSFFTDQVKELRILLREYQHLNHIYDDAEGTEFESRFDWILPYTSGRELPETFGLIPRDLRLENQHLHQQLTPAIAGLPGDEINDTKLIRDEWIRKQARTTSITGRRRLKIRVGTFNVNGKLPSQDLSGWIRSQTSTNFSVIIPPLKEISPLSLGEFSRDPNQQSFDFASEKPQGTSVNSKLSSISNLVAQKDADQAKDFDPDPDPDILVLGFQELDLSTEALIYSLGTAREDAWCAASFAALGEKRAHYEKLASKQLVGMLIVVIVKKNLMPCFTQVDTASAGAGIMGVMGNKGGTAARLTFTPPPNSTEITSPGSTTLTFVNAHLAAFDEMFEKRNSDFQDLSKRLKFTLGDTNSGFTAYETDVLIWMGDLNYRVDLPDEDIREILSNNWEGRLAILFKYDQLNKAIRNARAFSGFSEHPISHLPTYRFSPGVATDTLGYDIKRKPAWTDRILHMSAPSTRVCQLSYTSVPQVTMSDHRPVVADFVVDVDLYDKDLHIINARKYHNAVAWLGRSERSTVVLDKTSINMGEIRYRHSRSQKISVQNTGKEPCAYRFVALDHDSEIHPSWLSVEPLQAIILPGETVEINLTVHVDNRSASRLNLGHRELQATLILHTMMGKDHFISVTGEYQYTCYANTLSMLARLPGPIRSMVSYDNLRPEDQSRNAPREIMRLVNWMMSTQTMDGLFISPADESTMEVIRECLDTGDEFPFSAENADPAVAFAFAKTLLSLLESLTDPVVPTSLYPQCVQMMSRDEAFELLDHFPPVSVNVWISITAFLHFICQSSTTNKPSEIAERIATIFAPIFLRDDPDSPLPPVSPLGKRNFLLYFIT